MQTSDDTVVELWGYVDFFYQIYVVSAGQQQMSDYSDLLLHLKCCTVGMSMYLAQRNVSWM